MDMKTKLGNNKTGFTLVELSIVLVIIGLLIGGILVAQSLIDSAKVNRLISDLRQYEVATILFNERYGKYPGDSSYFQPAGNEDNAISGNGCDTTNTTMSGDEAKQFWAHLSQAEMLNQEYPIFEPTNCSGLHTLNDFFFGSLTPFTEVNPEAVGDPAILGGGISNKYSLIAGNYGNLNLAFELYTLPLVALSLESKLGVEDDNGQGNQLGLTSTTPGGVGRCWGPAATDISCADTSALVGSHLYYITR